jgi:hypothetical protein
LVRGSRLAQERPWLINAAAPGSPTRNVPLLVGWSEAIEVAALRSALMAVVPTSVSSGVPFPDESGDFSSE